MTAEERRENDKVNIGGQDLTIEKVISLLWRYKKALEGMTVGGSEFVNDPEYCAEWLRKGRDSSHNTILRLTDEKKKAYDAGRTAGLEEAAKVARDFLDNEAMPAKGNKLAAAIRALITAPQKG